MPCERGFKNRNVGDVRVPASAPAIDRGEFRGRRSGEDSDEDRMVNERTATVLPSSTARTANKKMPAAVIVQIPVASALKRGNLGVQVFAQAVA